MCVHSLAFALSTVHCAGSIMLRKTNPIWSVHTNVLSIITTSSQQDSGTRLWQCKYCVDQYSSTITRVKKHLTGIGCTDQIGACEKIPPPLKQQLIEEYFPVGASSLRGALRILSQILHEPLYIPDKSNPHLVSLFEGLLCKEPGMRISLEEVMRHPWLIETSEHDPVVLSRG
ncbi:hypothetical protein L7F22_029323 [Adiantum nelumboides]|nr:hypothetical protein [Adiantum nelumboides]